MPTNFASDTSGLFLRNISWNFSNAFLDANLDKHYVPELVGHDAQFH